MNILIITDAWRPQVNGVVTTLTNLLERLEALGHNVRVITPEDSLFSIPTPYPDVRICKIKQSVYKERIEWADAVHISTPEGTVGKGGLKACKTLGKSYTTGYHSKWPDFIHEMYPFVKASWVMKYMKHIHKDSKAILVPTPEVKDELEREGFQTVKVWTRGVDRSLFMFNDKPSDYIVCVSRVSKEKNLEEFFKLPGNKIMVGDGPMLKNYREKYPDVIFMGNKSGKELVHFFAYAQCFVFPSRTDTFGLVMIESMSCGTPVAAYPVTGPIDVIEPGVTGIMNDDLGVAVEEAIKLDRHMVREGSAKWDWNTSCNNFLKYLHNNSS